MGSTLVMVLAAVVLGIAQLAVGIVIGRHLPGGAPPLTLDGLDPVRLQRFARRLCQLAARVVGDVGEHQLQMEQVRKDLQSLASRDGSALADMVLGTIAQMMKANERLQHRLVEAEERLHLQSRQIASHITEAHTDALTGLPNRRAFDTELARRLAEWKRKQTRFCLLLIDADHFKRLNDRHGHPAGDQVLRSLAKTLQATAREMDLVARIGGEEFAVVLPGTRGCEACLATERIRSAVARTSVLFEQSELHLTVSLGLAEVETSDDQARLLRRADEALYASKTAGRNCGHFHNGQRCERISSQADAPAETPLSPEIGSEQSSAVPENRGQSPLPFADDDNDLTRLCDDLRTRLAEIAEGP